MKSEHPMEMSEKQLAIIDMAGALGYSPEKAVELAENYEKNNGYFR